MRTATQGDYSENCLSEPPSALQGNMAEEGQLNPISFMYQIRMVTVGRDIKQRRILA